MRSRGARIAASLAMLAAAWMTVGGSSAAAARARHVAAHGKVVWAPGSWCWFADPRAVNVTVPHPETIVGWIDWHGRVTVGAYEPGAGVVRSHVVGYLFHDDHGSPSLLVEPDNRITVFWSGHDGPRLKYRTTRRPGDITAWGPVHDVHGQIGGRRGFTYPNPQMLSAEHDKLYLFWRGADWSSDDATRSASGHWSGERRLISVPGQRPYLKVDSNGKDTIAFAFTDGHPRERTTSVYYAAYRNGSLWNAEGHRIGSMNRTPISPSQADRIYNGQSSGVSGWVWDVALNQRGRPVVVYATFPSAKRHLYWYAHFDGHRWVSHFLAVGGPTISPGTIETEYSGGIALDHANPSVVYLSRKVGGHFEIERWQTADGGYHWHHFTVVRTRGADDLRPVVPRGYAPGGIRLLWLQGNYGSYTTYRTRIAFVR